MLDQAAFASRISTLEPDQRSRLTTYVNEASFFSRLLAGSLAGLRPGSLIVEIGSGCGLLSMMFAEQGFRVVSFEPQLAGFSEMHTLRRILQECWVNGPPTVHWVDDAARLGSSILGDRADFGFSINVIEHVPDTAAFIGGAFESLKPSAELRIVCPNYAYPYESHFNMPTLFTKRLTEQFLGNLIRRQGLKDPEARLDPEGLWEGLSWPTAHKLKVTATSLGLGTTFIRDSTLAYLQRAVEDSEFRRRKGKSLSTAMYGFSRVASLVCDFLPPHWLPVLDLSLRRSGVLHG